MFVFENCTGLTLEANKGNSVISDCKTVKIEGKDYQGKTIKLINGVVSVCKTEKPKHPGESFYELKA